LPYCKRRLKRWRKGKKGVSKEGNKSWKVGNRGIVGKATWFSKNNSWGKRGVDVVRKKEKCKVVRT